ncbi:hypothetical protein C8Q80DRAFT_845191 [Daedaleopsis nitida]|nr:hypothetical protein C8Q80DRAFT_845191 [Daedaleopsis nitida]
MRLRLSSVASIAGCSLLVGGTTIPMTEVVRTRGVFPVAMERSVTLGYPPGVRPSASQAAPSNYHEAPLSIEDPVPHLSARAVEAADTSQASEDLPYIIAGCVIGGLLVLFALAAAIIYLRGRKYRGLDKPAPEGLRFEPGDTKAQRKTLVISRAAADTFSNPPLRDPMEKTKYGQATRRKSDAGDVLPTTKH